MNAYDTTLVPATALADEIDAICASTAFRHSPQQQRFLRHLVDRLSDGNRGALREISLAIDVFRRPPGNFDPKRDPIVRVEARRLRERLVRYYALEGEHAALEIVVPIGRYVPVVRPRPSTRAPVCLTPAAARALEERAWYVMRLRTIEGYRKALALFTRAASEFPDLASAYRGIAWARVCTAGYDGVPPEAGEQREAMRAAIDAACALEPEHPEIAALKGAYAARYDHALAAAERLYRDCLNRNPSSISSRTSYAWMCTLMGRFDEAQQLFEAAYALDPFGFWHRHNLGSLAYFRRDYATAEQIIREALELEPDHAVVRLMLARVLMQSGRGAGAVLETDWCRQALPGMTGAELFHIAALASAGHRQTAATAMRDFERDSGGRYTSSAYRAMAYTALDDPDRALEWLSRAATERDYWLLNVATDPAFDRLRSRGEFSAIVRAVGLA